MTEIKLTKRYPQSRTEDIVDAYMRGWNDALDAVQNGKFIINDDRKTENSSEKPNNYCDDCLYTDTCDSKEFFYACTSKATISKMEQVDKDINIRSKDEPNCEECKHFHENAVMYLDQCDFCFKDCKYEPKDEPQTMYYPQVDGITPSVIVKDEPQTETEIAKAIVHKMIDDAVIAEDAYPDLRQKMHDAVDEYEPQTDCAWKKGE